LIQFVVRQPQLAGDVFQQVIAIFAATVTDLRSNRGLLAVHVKKKEGVIATGRDETFALKN
jgi:hypothetical protein